MQVIWSADMYDINLLVFSKLVEGRVSAINTQSASRLRSAISRTTEHSYDGDSLSTQRFNVSSTDKASADNCRPQHAHEISQTEAFVPTPS
jgi:hypothetical protein